MDTWVMSGGSQSLAFLYIRWEKRQGEARQVRGFINYNLKIT